MLGNDKYLAHLPADAVIVEVHEGPGVAFQFTGVEEPASEAHSERPRAAAAPLELLHRVHYTLPGFEQYFYYNIKLFHIPAPKYFFLHPLAYR